jgi:hypothetical protein
MIRKILAFIISIVIFMLLWVIFLMPISSGFLFLVGIVGVLTGLIENGVIEPASIRVWEAVARLLTTALSWYISYKIYKKISIDNFNLKTFKTKNNLFFLFLILFSLMLDSIFFW